VENEAETYKKYTRASRVYHHSFQIELQSLLGLRADGNNTDADKLTYLAPGNRVEHLEPCKKVKNELCYLVVCRYRQIHDNLDDKEEVDAATEVIIHLLLFLGFLKSHNQQF